MSLVEALRAETQGVPEVRGRVVVAMSGGVDSSYVAAMLADEGNEVIGIAMRLYGDAQKAGRSCCSPDDLRDARQVAEEAGFPFYVVNYQQPFRERIMAYFVDEYRRGRTPSPCVLCNDHLKFDLLLQRMAELNADGLVTGHYAIIDQDETGRYRLRRGVDRWKDQSYFLFGLRREMLPKIRFPLGELTKPQVRERAEALGVPTARKLESQDICFVAGGSYVSFVEQHLKPEQIRGGNFRRLGSGEVLGRHQGIHRFTTGQRRGLGMGFKEILFVHSIDAETADVWLCSREELSFSKIVLHRCNWLAWETPPTEFEAIAQIRYRHNGCDATVTVDPLRPDVAELVLHTPVDSIPPGQAVVLYQGDEVVGGGWVEEAK